MYKRVPRTVKNSKNKEKELGSLNNNEIVEILPKKTRRRKTIEKKEVIRKPISIVKKLESNKSKEDLNETEKRDALFDIQKKIQILQNEKKKILDPSYNSFKSLEVRQTISFTSF